MADTPTTTRRWRGLEPEVRDEQRRRRLLDAGLELFGTKGYGATSIEELCSAAGVATRALYDLFGGREPVLIAVYDEIIAEVGAGVWAALDAEGEDLEAVVRAGVAAYVEPLVRDERKGRITQLELVGVSAQLEVHRRQVIRAFADGIDAQIARWVAAGVLPEGDRGLLALALTGGASEVLVDHLLTPKRRRRSLTALVDELARIWLLVLRPRR